MLSRVLQFFSGKETLEARLRRGPIPIPEVRLYARKLAEALARAHGHGWVYGNLHPGAIYLTEAGIRLRERLSRSNDTFYIAPEQAAGKAADARSDIFAFGRIVHEMTGGRMAFGHPLLSASLHTVVSKCLCPEPGDRWQSFGELAREFGREAVDASASKDLTLEIFAQGEYRRVDVRSAMNAGEFLRELTSGLGLPDADTEGQPIQWRIDNIDTRWPLQSAMSLADNGVRDGHRLTLHV